ncbi:MAG: uracil-DNA glycosylase, partial [Candidatus Heimdallarchaeota archaeon]
CKWYSVCPMKRYYEKGLLEKEWVENYCWGNWEKCVRYKMEEKGEFHPDWMLPDGSLSKQLLEKER